MSVPAPVTGKSRLPRNYDMMHLGLRLVCLSASVVLIEEWEPTKSINPDELREANEGKCGNGGERQLNKLIVRPGMSIIAIATGEVVIKTRLLRGTETTLKCSEISGCDILAFFFFVLTFKATYACLLLPNPTLNSILTPKITPPQNEQ
ncbi:hypothetical protein L6452_24677 [Arctium lappa]|uniref:Uncharacterized protein n=1 Tax=Arctium lappa TaxID=4217 RepID=A0ACB9AAW0_ARCLA|nr:hypothetical protein L6452_24677 [Arctium lappa]